MFSQFDNKKEILVVFLVLFVFMTGLGVKNKRCRTDNEKE